MRPSVEAIGGLALIVGAIAFVIFLGVEATLLYSAWRFRASRVAGQAPQLEGNRTLELVWTAIPLLVLVVVFVLMAGTMREIGATGGGTTAAELRIRAVGKQWWWEYRYPSPGGEIVAANELHIPVGVPVDLALESTDVVHSYWVPGLAGKTDMIPGRTNYLRLYASQPGAYTGQCAEFCGVEHAWMRIAVIAEPKAEYDRWLAVQATPRIGQGLLPARGEQVFTANLCASCHTIRGTRAAGKAGPDLTHVGSRTTLAAGVMKNDATSMRAWLADPQRYKPGSLMPRVPLADADIDALVAYLEGLK